MKKNQVRTPKKSISSSKKHKGKFRQSARCFFNTYPKTEILISKEKVQELFLAKTEHLQAQVKHLLISFETGAEKHDSKDYEHYHLLVKFDRKVEVIGASFWDLGGVHGHYKTLSKGRYDFRNAMSYCQKDGDYIEQVMRTPTTEPGEVRANSESALLAYLIDEVKKKDPKDDKGFKNAIESLLEKQSLDTKAIYRLNENKLLKGLKNEFTNIFINIGDRYDRCSFQNVPEAVQKWEQEDMYKKALIIRGRSGIGKTSFVKTMFKNPLLVSCKEELKGLTGDHDAIIFDDFAFDNLKEEEKIHFLDLENNRGIDVKFGHIVLKARLPRVLITNESLYDFLGYINMEEIPEKITRRIIDVVIVDDMRPNESQ